MKWILPFFLFFSENTLAQIERGEVVVDPSIRIRCENLQVKKQRKIENRENLTELLGKSQKLLSRTPYNKTSIRTKLGKSQEDLRDLISLRNREITELNDTIVRRGCPADSFDLLTDSQIKKFLQSTEKSVATLKGWQKKKTDYSAAEVGYDGISVAVADAEDQEDIRQMVEELKSDEEVYFTSNNHIGFSIFRYTQSYNENIEGLDTLENNRTASLGLGFYYVYDDKVLDRLVRYYLTLNYATEGELELSDENNATKTFEEHTNFIVNGGIHLNLWNLRGGASVGLFGFLSRDNLATLYAENPSAVNPVDVLGIRNYSLVWWGGGIDYHGRFLTRQVSLSTYLAAVLNETSDIDTDQAEETLAGTRFGLEFGVHLYKKIWGEFKYVLDSYSGSSNLDVGRTTFSLRYDLF